LTVSSSKSLLLNKTKGYDGDFVKVSVENKGSLSEYVGFRVYLPEQVDLLEFNSKSSGPKGNFHNKASSRPLQLAELNDDELLVHELQTASTRSTLKGGNEIDYTFNYETEKPEEENQSKQTNQFLTVLDLYSDKPENLKITFSSANFDYGNYPDASKHRWLIRTHAGYSLSLDVKKVDLERDLDTVNVYDVSTNGNKKLLREVELSTQLDTSSNQLLVVFKSDCSVSRSGFSAIVTVVENHGLKSCGVPPELENGFSVVSGSGEVVYENENVTYYCNDPYTMVDDALLTIECVNGAFLPSLAEANIVCKLEPVWSEWTNGSCSRVCGGGIRTDTRNCTQGECEGPSERTTECNTQECTDCFTYAVTSNPEGWNEAQQSCKNQFGGQLVSKNLGASGSAYHQLIKETRAANMNKHLWVGLTDDEVEGEWKFQPSNELLDFNGAMINWMDGQPDNWQEVEHCAHINAENESGINDLPCYKIQDWDVYGLCEIEADHCKP